MNLQPLHNYVVIKPLSAETITQSGIVLPDTIDKGRPEQGEVIAIGPGKLMDNGQLAPMSVAVGNKVMFRKYSPDEIKLDNQEYLVIKEDDIMAILG